MNTDNRNLLYNLAAIGGVFLAIFLLAGAYGHLAAVLPAIGSESSTAIGPGLVLLLPGLLLLATGILNVALCRFIWSGRQWSLQLALLGNGLTLAYLAYLLWAEVPDHPIGLFLAMVTCYVVLLGATRFGLVWPSRDR